MPSSSFPSSSSSAASQQQQQEPLIPPRNRGGGGGPVATTQYGTGSTSSSGFGDIQRHAWARSNGDKAPTLHMGRAASTGTSPGPPRKNDDSNNNSGEERKTLLSRLYNHTASPNTTPTTTVAVNTITKTTPRTFAYYIIYAFVNVIISVPGLYGYASVIFNHPIYQPHMNALSKLVIFSSLIHQLSFTLFSGLPFAIGTVQDAGLIFLSAMSKTIAHTILKRGGTDQQVLSTALVLLSLGTAALGCVLVLIGKFKLADAVSYLPMPVVGGYLAFIGYFCLEAGVALCISQSMTTVQDWAYLFNAENALHALPGLLAGLVLTWLSRTIKHDAVLPAAMVIIPAAFYLLIACTGLGLEGARDGGWVGATSPPVPLSDLFHLVDFSQVQWDLAREILFTWVGMVLVVSFASCLDVAAISMDMGEPLDTNHELATVGIGNIMSGLAFGYTGSYIFSQTIFTYRTGVHSRWVGIFIMIVFLLVVISPVNLVEVSPLFFLGSTLIFIGYDLIYEWLLEVRKKIFLSEYLIVWATFIAIQVVGMDFGIVM